MKLASPRVALALVAALAVSATAEAGPRRGFSSNKKFGLGVILGVPTGLSGKYFLSGDTAFDFAVGFIRYYRYRHGIHAHADFLWHPINLVSTDPFELPLYFGIGGRIFDFDDNDRYDDDGFAIGVRAPIGIAFDFNDVPLDVFVEL